MRKVHIKKGKYENVTCKKVECRSNMKRSNKMKSSKLRKQNMVMMGRAKDQTLMTSFRMRTNSSSFNF